MKLTLFTEELRECLNAAGLSDCGENDEWNYWYQRLLKAHSESVERQTMTEVAENAELRELVRIMKNCADECGDCDTCPINGEPGVLNPWLGCDSLRDLMRELGVEVDE